MGCHRSLENSISGTREWCTVWNHQYWASWEPRSDCWIWQESWLMSLIRPFPWSRKTETQLAWFEESMRVDRAKTRKIESFHRNRIQRDGVGCVVCAGDQRIEGDCVVFQCKIFRHVGCQWEWFSRKEKIHGMARRENNSKSEFLG